MRKTAEQRSWSFILKFLYCTVVGFGLPVAVAVAVAVVLCKGSGF